jgi:hypothetical protein
VTNPVPPVPGSPPGFLRTIKAGTVTALQQALTWQYPEADAAGGAQAPYISVEYPVNAGDYPGVWVDFETTMLQVAGLDYTEMNPEGQILTRWRFQGYSSFTITALNSNECDELYDQMVALTAFAAQSDYPSAFRSAVEDNALVSTTWSFDTVEQRGNNAAPGTPWGTDEMIYERGMALKVIGEFVTSPVTLQLYSLREIIVTGQAENYPADKFIATI